MDDESFQEGRRASLLSAHKRGEELLMIQREALKLMKKQAEEKKKKQAEEKKMNNGKKAKTGMMSANVD